MLDVDENESPFARWQKKVLIEEAYVATGDEVFHSRDDRDGGFCRKGRSLMETVIKAATMRKKKVIS